MNVLFVDTSYVPGKAGRLSTVSGTSWPLMYNGMPAARREPTPMRPGSSRITHWPSENAVVKAVETLTSPIVYVASTSWVLLMLVDPAFTSSTVMGLCSMLFRRTASVSSIGSDGAVERYERALLASAREMAERYAPTTASAEVG